MVYVLLEMECCDMMRYCMYSSCNVSVICVDWHQCCLCCNDMSQSMICICCNTMYVEDVLLDVSF